MTREHVPNEAAPDPAEGGVEGERGISSITSPGSSRLNDKNKKALVAAGLVFLGAMAVLQFPSGEEPAPQEEQQRPPTTIRPGRNFQPADLTLQLAPEEAPAEEENLAPDAPLGPIERVRHEEQMTPAEPSEAEQLYEASKRAPVMAYQGTLPGPARSAGHSGADAETAFFGGSSEAGTKEPVGLAARLVTGDRSAEQARVLAHPNLTLTQGTTIPCALDTAMESTAPGMVRCTVTDDVYSTTGTVILLDRGTRIVGEYQGGMQRGRARLFVLWTRAETPTGVIVNLGSPGADALGQTGFDGDIDTQFWTRFGGTMMLSVIDDALILAAGSGEGDGDITGTSRSAARNLAQTELESTLDVPVILRKNQGEDVSVMVARDLDFSGVYRLK